MDQIKRTKNQRGFTLVEVIVVAIIVAALAAVAVPMYTSYVSSSRTNAAANAAGSVASFMGSCINQAGEVSGTGLAEGQETKGEVAITAECKTGTGATAKVISSIQLPIGIMFTISSFNTNGYVRTKHVASTAVADTAHYNY